MKPLYVIFVLSFFMSGCLSEFTVNNPSTLSPPPSTTTDPDPGDPPPTNPNPTPPDPDPTDPPPTDPPPTGSNLVPVFMATGHVRTTMYSCTGETWRGYRTANSNTRCWDDSSPYNVECDHQATSAMGITYGPNGFMATFGWGTGGRVEVSTDGNNWTSVHTGGTWAGVAYGNGTYILNDRPTLLSTNGGETWTRGGDLNFIPWNARKISFVNLHGGFFISTADSSGVMDLLISRDNGASFSRPTALPSNCGNGTVAYNSSVILLYSRSLCRSTDNGQTWQELPTKPGSGNLISVGNQFKAYNYGRVYTSTDNGSTWTEAPLLINGVQNSQSANLSFEHVAYNSQLQKYVGIVQSWGNYYERTQYYHSDDGRNWIQINKSAGQAPNSSHPIRQIVTGYLPQSSCN